MGHYNLSLLLNQSAHLQGSIYYLVIDQTINKNYFLIKTLTLCPGQVAWLEHHLIRQKVAGSIPGWGAYTRQLIIVSFSYRWFSLSLLLSLKPINISLGED